MRCCTFSAVWPIEMYASGSSPESRGSAHGSAPPAARRAVRAIASANSGLVRSTPGTPSLVPRANPLTSSTPAEMYASPSPARIAWKAMRVVCSDDAQYRVIVVPGRWS